MKLITYLIFSTALMVLFGSCQDKEEIFNIPEGHVGMFGYGSLMSKNFIESGLLEKDYDGPFLSAHLKGHKRSWTFSWPTDLPQANVDGVFSKDYILIAGDTIYPKRLHYLNIREDANSIINGVLYIVPEADLPTYDEWELGYERFEVTDLIEGYTVTGGPVFAYKALPDFVSEPTSDPRQNIIEAGYLKILQEGFDYWGKGFEAEYQKSTEPVDASIILENQKIPWIDPPLDKIEELRSIFKYSNP